jgi:hemoglobin
MMDAMTEDPSAAAGGTPEEQAEPEVTPYDLMGGSPFFATLVHRFYEGVAEDPVLRPMYPSDDMDGAETRLRMFLEQYWGGPTTYSEERGHPRLRMRHAPYPVDDTARAHWLANMRVALDYAIAKEGLHPRLEEELWGYLVTAAQAMVNSPGPGPDGVLPTIGDPA